ncbi:MULTISPECIES: hypothetical protein [Pseudoalteromonas]|nr:MULTISPECIES: hypothetical protein [Pseudoalteromonas]
MTRTALNISYYDCTGAEQYEGNCRKQLGNEIFSLVIMQSSVVK